MEKENQRVVCACNKIGDMLFTGVRHYCPIMRMQIKMSGIREQHPNYAEDIQGFVDNYGDFLTRKEALKIALEKEQVLDVNDIRGGVLYSEDLY